MLLSFLLGALCVGLVAAVDPLVDVTYTKYQGTALSNGITQWLGVRYAAPPLGNLRFAAPQDPVENSTIQIADAHGPICLSTPGTSSPPSNTSDEDCLFLDVYAPSNATSTSKLPVFFFIQGGGFNTNSNANYNGSGLIMASDMNIVVVNFNYRVGPYGFLAAKEVNSTNNGLKDQRKALEWVQMHITKFGGNPGHVTMGGDSAGAASVNLQLTAYNGRDYHLFHATAAESQSFAAIRTVPECQYQYDNLVIRTGCASSNNTLACLRGLNATFLQSVNINTPFPGAQDAPLYMYGPVLDGGVVSDYTYRAYAEGKFVRVPAIYGDDTNGGTVFTPKNTSTVGEMDTFLKDQFPALTLDQLSTINKLYPKTTEQWPDSGPYWRALSNAYGETRYMCPGLFISSTYFSYNISGNYNYHWNVIDPILYSEGYGVTHTIEVNAIWGPENVNGGAPASYEPGGVNAEIVGVVQGYWTSFVRTYDPNVYRKTGSPVWEEWAGGEGQGEGWRRLMFQTNQTRMETVDAGLQGRCRYLSSIGLALKQ